MPGVEDLAVELSAELDSRLAAEDDALVARFPGERPGRQPVHTVYVPADRYAADLTRSWGAQARQAMRDHDDVLRDCLGEAAPDLLPLVEDKLDREPIEDLRIDFEDGYGTRPDDVEDADVARAARALAQSQEDGTASAVVRDPDQELRAADEAPRARARSSGSSTTCSRPEATSTASSSRCRR